MDDKRKIGCSCSFPGLGTLLTVLFIALKLCGVIAWSWVWVLAPLWISVAIAVFFIIVSLIILAIVDHNS